MQACIVTAVWQYASSTLSNAIRDGAVPAKSDIPIVAMTGHAMHGDKERFLAIGMNNDISKPIEKATLLAVD